MDLVIEVKNWEKTVSQGEIQRYLELKAIVEQQVNRKTDYLFYSENGFTEEQQASLRANGVMYSTNTKLTSYEAE